jgi:hypothetical protein
VTATFSLNLHSSLGSTDDCILDMLVGNWEHNGGRLEANTLIVRL